VDTASLLAAVAAAHVTWATITSEHAGNKLRLDVMADAMRFDGVPAMTWARKPVAITHPDHGRVFDGVRLPATASELNEIAKLTGSMLMTPLVVDLLWAQADVRLESVVNVRGVIVAVSDIHKVHEAIERELAGRTGLIEAPGKYWVNSNRLVGGKFGVHQAVNYGWPSRTGNSLGVMGTHRVWQPPGARHDSRHSDPSQVIRLMRRAALLLRAGSTEWVDVDLHDVAIDPQLAGLISHEGVLVSIPRTAA
jgi:hypothetical protein